MGTLFRGVILRLFPSLLLAFWTFPVVLGEDAAILIAPERFHAGGNASFTLTTIDSATLLPISRPATVRLIPSGNGEVTTLFSGQTGEQGRVHREFQVPSASPDTFYLQADVTGVNEVLELSMAVDRTPAILIETDKPIYKPGQTVRGRILLLNSSLKPISEQVEVTIHDAKGLRIARFELQTDEFGAVPFDLDLAQELNLGTWKVRAGSGSGESVRDIRVETYALPRFELSVSTEKGWALVDEEVQGLVEAKYFFGKDVEGQALVSAKRWVGAWEEYARIEGELAGGQFNFELPPVGFVAGTPGASGQGTVTLDVVVTDSTGHEQSSTEIMTISEAPVVLSLTPSSDTVKPGIPTDVLLLSKTPAGEPADLDTDVEIRFYSDEAESLGSLNNSVRTEEGAALLSFTAPQGTSVVEVEASAQIQAYEASTVTQIGSAYSPGGIFIALTRVGSGPVTVGEQVTYAVTATNPGTVYYEVYAGGRTVFSAAAEQRQFSFTVTPEMVPAARVVAYMIASNNEVAADSSRLEVNLSLSVSIVSAFDPSSAVPGEKIDLELDAGTGRRTLLGVSVVDESVLALGRSRLHLADVFAELEKRFLEPQIEIHEPDEPAPPGPAGPFLAPPRTRGALDVLQESGLQADASQGIMIFEGGVLDAWREDVVVSPGGGAAENVPPEPPRLRHYFPETWVWEPMLLTDETGRARLSLTAPDSITTWKLTAVGTCPDVPSQSSAIAFGETELTVFQDFFVEPSLPYSVVRGETISIRVDIFNYLKESQNVRLLLEADSGFEMMGDQKVEVEVPANSVKAAYFEILPRQLGNLPIQFTALGETAGDAVLRQLKVVPEGLPAEQITNGVLEAGSSLSLDPAFPVGIVDKSERSLLFISPSPIAQSMSGVSDLLGMPFGCGEQNMIFLAPDIEILKYLREIGELAPEIRAEAEYYVNVGYQRQLTFQTDDGGFAAFAGDEGSLWLTAFVLSTFSGAREVRDIDEAVLLDAAEMLLSRQRGDGSFETDDFLIHKEMDGGMENEVAMTSYVASALADYGTFDTPAPLAAAAGFIVGNLTEVWEDPYSLAIAAIALQKIPGNDQSAEQVLDRLLELAITEGVGLYWEPYPVETTGYAAMALLASGTVGRPEAQGALDWLSTQRNSLGGYGTSTQDTVVALRALFTAARKAHRDIEVEIVVTVDGEEFSRLYVDASNYDLLQQLVVPVKAQMVDLQSLGTGSVSFQWVKRFNVPGEFLPPPKDMDLVVEYATDHVAVDDIVDVFLTLSYFGWKEETGMVVVDIGVPTGFEPVSSSLASLVEKQVVERADVAGRKVILYFDSLENGETYSLSFEIRALYPVRAEGPISRVYEYYDPQIEAYHQQGSVVVTGPPPALDSVSSQSAMPGESLILRGSGFSTAPVRVFFGDLETGSIEVLDDNTIVVVVPASSAASGAISVVTESGSSSLPTPFEILPPVFYVPLYRGGPNDFTGLALVNRADSPASVELSPFGGLSSGASPEPSISIRLEPGEQLARLVRELLPGSESYAWLEVKADRPEIAACFQLGNTAGLAGAGALVRPVRSLFLPRVNEGNAALAGQPAHTSVMIANPYDEETLIRLQLVAEDMAAQPFEVERDYRIVGRGAISVPISELLQDGTEVSRGYVGIAVEEGEGIVGFGLVEVMDEGALLGVSFSDASPVTSSYVPLVAQNSGVVTWLSLVNTSDELRSISLALSPAQASESSLSAHLELQPGQGVDRSLDDLFDLEFRELQAASLSVESDGTGVLGGVVLVDPLTLRFAVSSQLETRRVRGGVFAHFARGGGFFTGLALLNTGLEIADIELTVYFPSGERAGGIQFPLGPGECVSKLLRELLPESGAVQSGYLVIETTEPIVAQQIIGGTSLDFLSNIPMNVLR
jgi:CD109 antigen